MKPKQVIVAFSVVAIAVVLYYSLFSGAGQQEYVERINNERQERDDFMRNSKESPFASDPSAFTGLKFFPPNPKYLITADLSMAENRKVVILPTSDEKEARYQEYAYASFELDGVKCRLTVLESIDMGPTRGTLFLPFADQTSALDTYGAGRYLDVKKVPGAATITLDFNLAYNPYCAYSDAYSCPLPPRENMLNVIIAAGEKVYHDDH